MKITPSLFASMLGQLLFASCSYASSNYWVANIGRFGEAAFNPNASTYKVFRNVMDPEFGAKGILSTPQNYLLSDHYAR